MNMSGRFNQPAPFRTQITLLPVLVCGVLLSQALPADDHAWKTYTNARFRYGICYPADLLVPQGEADNSDGQAFLAKDGAKLLVYGSNNALNQTLKNVLDDTASRLARDSGKVTYKAIKRNWFVVSGQDQQTVFYAKTIYAREQFKSFELTYDSSLSAVYKPVLNRLAGCFADLKP
jgi:hypothetical protein